MDFQTLTPRGVRWIKNNWDNFDFEMSIQRRGGLWTPKKRTMMVHTAIANYPCNPVFMTDNGDKTYEFIDGKQRMTTMKDFIDDKFSLTEDIFEAPYNESVVLDDLVNKKFSELSKEYQDAILDFRFQYIAIKDATEEEVEEIMFRLNQGELMNQMELLRLKIGQKMRDYMRNTTNLDFFKNIVAFSKTDRLRFTDEATTLQCLAIILDKDVNFGGKEFKNFALSFKEEGVSEETQGKLKSIAEYLYKAFYDDIVEDKNCVPTLKKIHIPMIFKTANEYMNEVDSKQFGTIIKGFLEEQGKLRKEHKKNADISIGRYNEAVDSGSAKKENINVRCEEMCSYADEKIAYMNEEMQKSNLELVEQDERGVA